MADSQSASRLVGCLLGGALGDALGAPAEGIRTLEGVTSKFGKAGLTQMHPYTCPWETVSHTGVGAVTDDTTMHAATLGAMMASAFRPDQLHLYALQSYIRWAINQEDGLRILPLVDLTVDWPRELHPFWFACGAGRGTIAALATGKAGTTEQPLQYDTIIREKRVIGPNAGCGGMMRTPVLAFWPHVADKFRLGMENGALTHGAPDAYLATGCVAELTHGIVQGLSLPDAFNRMTARLTVEPQHEATLAACSYGWQAGAGTPSLEAIDAVPRALGYKNAFLASPVMGQVAFALSASHHHGLSFKETLTLAVSHSGDSDSVGAIVGNVLGAACSEQGLPRDWVKQTQLSPQLEALGQRAVKRLSL